MDMRNPFSGNFQRVRAMFGGIVNEAAFRKRIRNFGHLFAGNIGAAALSFFAVAMAARSLGVELYGVLALVSAFIQAIERFVSFQTWQPLIRYGAALRDQRRGDDLKSLIKFTFLLDVAAAIAGFALAVSFAFVGADWFNWSAEVTNSLLLYACVLLFLINGTPTGVMRLSGRFREIAYFQVVAMTVRCVLAAAAFYLKAGLFVFVAIWAATHLLSSLLLVMTGFQELRRLGFEGFLQASVANMSGRFPNIWRFSILANLSLTARSSAHQLDTLLVGALAGPAGAGLYHIAKRIAKFAQQAGQHVQAVVFPDIARLWALGDVAGFRKDVARTEAVLVILCGVGVVATLLLADPVVGLFAGGDFGAAGGMLKVQIVAVAAMLAGSVTRAALLCMGRETTVFALTISSTVIFFILAAALLPDFGAIGASYAHAVAGLFIVAAYWIAYRLALRAGPKAKTQSEGEAPSIDDSF